MTFNANPISDLFSCICASPSADDYYDSIEANSDYCLFGVNTQRHSSNCCGITVSESSATSTITVDFSGMDKAYCYFVW